MEQELNDAIKRSCPFFLNDDLLIIKTSEFREAAGFIIKFIADYRIILPIKFVSNETSSLFSDIMSQSFSIKGLI